MARSAFASPGNSTFERSMKYVHASWLLFGGLVAFISLVVFANDMVTWHLPFAMPVAIVALGYGLILLISHMHALERRRMAWARGVPATGRVVEKAAAPLGSGAYVRVTVECELNGRTQRFTDKHIYPHVADRMRLGDSVSVRYRPDEMSVFAFDMRM